MKELLDCDFPCPFFPGYLPAWAALTDLCLSTTI